jgi:5-methyltetrahydrofolate--homocysteine methyltransferase
MLKSLEAVMSDPLQDVFDGVVDGKHDDAQASVARALDLGVSPEEILTRGLIAAMAEVGDRFEAGEFYVPEMILSARAMKSGLAVLRPRMVDTPETRKGVLVIGTVKGDLHDIGKNLVAMMFEGAGYRIVDLGTDVSPDAFAEAVRTHQPSVVAMSALLTTTMLNMNACIAGVQASGLRDRVKVLVGGAPVTAAFAREVGADGFAPDASRAVKVAHDLLRES